MKSKFSPQPRPQKGRYFDLMTWHGFDNIFNAQHDYSRFLAFANAIFGSKHFFSDGAFVSGDSFLLVPPSVKAKKFDILCKVRSRALIIAERARYKTKDFDKRNIERLEVAIGNSRRDKEKPRFDSFVNINIADFVVWEDREEHIHVVGLAAVDERPEDILNITIELPKFNKDIDELETELDKWLYLLKNMPYLTKRPAVYDTPVFKELFKCARLPL